MNDKERGRQEIKDGFSLLGASFALFLGVGALLVFGLALLVFAAILFG